MATVSAIQQRPEPFLGRRQRQWHGVAAGHHLTRTSFHAARYCAARAEAAPRMHPGAAGATNICRLATKTQLLSSPGTLNRENREPAFPQSWWQELFGGVWRVAALLGLALCLTLTHTQHALAARSGGRVGGSAGFSRAASSSAGFGGGGFGGGSSRSYGGGWGGSSSGFGSSSRGVRAHTTTTHHHHTISPSFGLGFGFGAPMSGYGTGGYGYASPAPITHASLFFGAVRSFFTVVTLTAMVVMLVALTRQSTSTRRAASDDGHTDGAMTSVTVSRVRVCVLGVARGLREELDALGTTANTATTQGLHMLLQETVLALLRHPSYWVFAGGESQTLPSANAAESAFSAMTLEQRAHVQQETLVNANGLAPRMSKLAKGSDDVSELLVVSILVAAQGRWSLPPIRSVADLRAALTRLGALAPSNIMAVELMWSPQAENDSLTQQEVIAEYPDLVPL